MARADLAVLLEKQGSTFRSWHLREPVLVFANGGQSVDPKTGLALFGPWETPEAPSLSSVRLAIIGTSDTISAAQHWLERCRNDLHPSGEVDPVLFPSFPGFESPSGFGCRIEIPGGLIEVLTPAEVKRCTTAPSRDHAVERMSQLLSERLRALSEKEAPPDVVVVALPNEVREAAGGGRNPRRHAASRTSKRQDGQLRLAFMDEPEAETEPESRTLHRAIKAEGMRWSLCTQLAWPATFSGGDTVEDDATRAWNFCTGLYYKAGGVPWRVSGLGKNTCYVGISFFRPLGRERTLQTSLAQAFADRGDGIILRGESFEWDLRKQGSPHLSKESACRLLKDVLDAYTRHHRQRPVRVVVHKSSDFDEGEIEGLKDALGGHVPYYDFLSIGKSSTRFMRVGHEPPLRGTVIEVAPKEYVFYTRGYVPFLKVYPGLRVPRPLAVRHCEGSAPVTELLAEILALTKLNWNSSAFGASEPITLHFARDVGLILSELPEGIQPKELYRYYM